MERERMDARTALKNAKAAQEDIDAILKRAGIRPQPPRKLPRPDRDDVIGAIALIGLFFVLFVVPWGM